MFQKIHHLEYKKRYLAFVLFLCFLFFIALNLLKPSFASYLSSTNLAISPDISIYLFQEEMPQFNLETTGIKPSSTPYVYTFSVSNYKDEKQSDVDLMYTLTITTTTNLPLEYKLYRNENYQDSSAVNLLDTSTLKQDEDGTWYHIYAINQQYTFYYQSQMKDLYYLVINFDPTYASNIAYADLIDNIHVQIQATQIID